MGPWKGGPVDVGEKIGKFQVLSTLGTGAHSTILHVRRLSDGKQYALKVVPLETADEVRAARDEAEDGLIVGNPGLIPFLRLDR